MSDRRYSPALPYLGFASLPELGLLKIDGADSVSFLQAQLTNDVATLAPGQCRSAGYCSVKGRLLASFWIWREASERDGNGGEQDGLGGDPKRSEPAGTGATFWLACSRELATPVAKRLAMFVLRAKVKVADVSEQWSLLGLTAAGAALPAANAVAMLTLDPAITPARKPPTGRQFWHRWSMPSVEFNPRLTSRLAEVDAGLAFAATGLADLSGHPRPVVRSIEAIPVAQWQQRLSELCAQGFEPLPGGAWLRLEVLSGVARITAENQDRFVPQMINFERVGGVSFTKGCYPGQEVVARSQYLGKLKRRLFLGFGTGKTPLPGTDVVRLDESAATPSPIGLVVLAAELRSGRESVESDADSFFVQFECRIDALASSGSVRIGDTAIVTLPLPYALDAEAVVEVD